MPSSLNLIISRFWLNTERCESLPFTQTVRYHCRVPLGFISLLFLGVGSLGERGRPVSGLVTLYILFLIKFAILYGHSLWCPKTNNIKDHWLQIIIKIYWWKSLKCCENYKNVYQRHKVRKCYWKNGAKWITWCRIAKIFNLKKKKKKKEHEIL